MLKNARIFLAWKKTAFLDSRCNFQFLALKVPGKLNLNDFQKVSAALQSKRPVPASEDIDQHGYAVPKDTMGGGQEKSEYAQPVDLQEPKPASRSKPRHRERREQRASHPGNFYFSSLKSIS